MTPRLPRPAAGAGLTRRLSHAPAPAAAATAIAAAITAAAAAIAATAATAAAVTTAVIARRAGLGRLAGAVSLTGAVSLAGTFSPAGTFPLARVMFARLRGLCLPWASFGLVRMFAGLRSVVVTAGLGPTMGPRLSLAIAWGAVMAAVAVAAVAALTGLARSVAGSCRRGRGGSDYGEARREYAGRSGNSCPRRHDVTPPSCLVSAHNNLTTLTALTLNLLSA